LSSPACQNDTIAIKDKNFKIIHTNLLVTFFFFFSLLLELTINSDVKFRLNLAVGFQCNDIEITPFLHPFIFDGQRVFLLPSLTRTFTILKGYFGVGMMITLLFISSPVTPRNRTWLGRIVTNLSTLPIIDSFSCEFFLSLV
jgi:hypothetical protein